MTASRKGKKEQAATGAEDVKAPAETPASPEAREAGQPGESRPKTKAELVSKVIENIEKKLEAGDVKPTVGDFIRLLQLEKELEEEQPREIKVSWIEPGEKEHASDT